MRKLLVEFLGTFFLFLFIGFISFNEQAAPMAPLFIGIGLAALIYMGAGISGGHYNPALTFSAWIGGFPVPELIRYFCGQFAGVITAGLVLSYFNITASTHEIAEVGPALLGELLFTFLLAFVFLSTTNKVSFTNQAALAISFVVIVGGFAVRSFSGAVLNPAIFVGNCINGSMHFSDIWLYFVAQFGGAALAALSFNYFSAGTENS